MDGGGSCGVNLGAAMTGRLVLWAMRFWHELAGHPRPWRVLEDGMFCVGCGEKIRRF